MNLLEAKQAWAEGKRVRKKNWHVGQFVQLRPESGNDTEMNRLFLFDNDQDGLEWEIY